jgi:diacylglycerol kinase family enzyme
LTYESEV